MGPKTLWRMLSPMLMRLAAWTGMLLGLFPVLVMLKLGSVLPWPWLWVCAPLWLPIATLVTFAILVVVGLGLLVLMLPPGRD